MSEIKKILAEKIAKCGPISFAEFMEAALYHPAEGYYSKNLAAADYYTSADVHPVFAQILALAFKKEWERNLKDEPRLNLVELGAGEGKLCGNILGWFKSEAPAIYEKCRYLCVEKSAARRAECENLEKKFPGRVEAVDDFNLPEGSFRGIVFSNEFFDALPFHRVINENGGLKEILIGPNFKEIHAEMSEPLQDYFDWLGFHPPEGCVGEAQIAAREWLAKIAKTMAKGLVLTIDYGFEAQEIFSEIRCGGTALCHYRHKTTRDFYSRIAEQDITAHVNFTVLAQEGENWGLRPSKLRTQSQFIAENALEEAVQAVEKTTDPRAKLKISSALKSLLHPEGMGGVFKVLLQRPD